MKNILTINQDIEKKDSEDFVREYQELCKKYKRAFVPQITLGLIKTEEKREEEQK